VVGTAETLPNKVVARASQPNGLAQNSAGVPIKSLYQGPQILVVAGAVCSKQPTFLQVLSFGFASQVHGPLPDIAVSLSMFPTCRSQG